MEVHTLAFAEIDESVVLKHNTEQKKNTFHSLYPQDALHYTVHTQQADREHYSWPYVTCRDSWNLFLYPQCKSKCKIRLTLHSDSPSFLEWRRAERRGRCSNDTLTASMFCGVRTVLTLPPFFLTVEPVSSKLFTHVFMAWADSTLLFR